MDCVQFRVLGPLEVELGGQLVVPARRQERCLLGALLLQPSLVQPVHRLADLLWDGEPPGSARRTIHSHVSRLRSLLAGAGADRHGVALVSGGDGYRLTVPDSAVDAHWFRSLLTRAGDAAGPGERLNHLRAALKLWRGPVLQDSLSDRSRQRYCADFEELHLAAIEDVMATNIGLRREREILPELAQLAGAHPERESLVALYMRALYQLGRKTEALAAYTRTRTHLAETLGTDPGQPLRELYRAVLRDEVFPDPGPATPITATARAELLEPAVTPSVPQQLPPGITGFTGRGQYLAQLDDLLALQGQPPPVVISGSAGVGKTALALHWAHRVRDQFPDGQLFLDLRGYSPDAALTPLEALTTLLRMLGSPPDQLPVDLAEAAAAYRSLLADRRILIVLDNADSVAQVRPLLPGGERVVVITSRDRLRGLVARDGAHHVSLPVLSPDEARELLATVIGAGPVATEPTATAALAEVCAYLPLALRIAAANLAEHPGQSITEYVAALHRDDQFLALEVDGDADSSVRAALDRSYRRLPVAAQRLFRMLGLAPGPDFTPAAAAALSGMTEAAVQPPLRLLVRAHLLESQLPGRYAFHDLLRRYARHLAEQPAGAADAADAAARWFDYHLHTADAAAATLHPGRLRLPVSRPPGGAATFPDPAAAMAWFEAERANLVLAVRYAAESGPPAMAWLLSDRLRGYLWESRRLADWETVTTAALAAATAAGDLPGQVAALLGRSDLELALARYPEAIENLRQARDRAVRAGWPQATRTALGKLGVAYWLAGQLEPAAAQLRASLTGASSGQDLGEQAAQLGNLGCVYRELGRLPEAAECLHRVIALHHQRGTLEAAAIARNNLGVVLHEQGQLAAALAESSQALAVFQQLGSRQGQAYALDSLAAVHRDTGTLATAQRLAKAAIRLAVEIGDRRTEADALSTLGRVLLRQHRLPLAERCFERAWKLARRLGSRIGSVSAQLGQAAVHRRSRRPAEAENLARRALVAAQDAGYRVLAAEGSTELAAALLDQRRFDEAARLAAHALAESRHAGYRLGEVRALALLGNAYVATAPATAQRHWRAARELQAELGAAWPSELPDRVGC